ncbi:hypothetical protein Rhal01_02551 [Rubritalea halochordaticola]|uniref:Uncharacterized protein n=1 Tax=Rubritalea halochordaticola TaxID=714537 RepID=A0ABP9V0Z1_9BACT
MRLYLHVLSRDPELEQSPSFEASVWACVADAPGILSVTSVEPHTRGGFSVVADSVENLPDEFGDYFERSKLMLVI